MLTLSIILSVAIGAISVAAGWLLIDRRAHRQRADALSGELDEARQQNESLRAELAELNTQVAVARQTHEHLKQQFDHAQQQLRDAFSSLAGDALKKSSEQFLQLAKQTFEAEQRQSRHQLDQRQQAIAQLVDPVRKSLEQYQQALRQIEAARQQSYGELRQQVHAMVADQQQLKQETSKLVAALRRPEVRGRWGEMQLRRVAELAGMIEHCDFSEQVSVAAGQGQSRLRPDMVVHLPGEGALIIDAKTPLDAYLSALETDDPQQQSEAMAQHVRQIESKVRELSGKDYLGQFERTPQFVILFIPGDGFLQPAVQREPELIEHAMQRGVVIATPSTLIALLKVVALGWNEQRVAESAQQVSELGKELHDRIVTAAGHADKVGQSLKKAVESYNSFVGSLESRVLVTARKFEQLGAGSNKALPEQISEVDQAVRSLHLTDD